MGRGWQEGKRERARLFYGCNNGANSPPQDANSAISHHRKHTGGRFGNPFLALSKYVLRRRIPANNGPNPSQPNAVPPRDARSASRPFHLHHNSKTLPNTSFPPPRPLRPPSCDPRFALQPPERLWLKQRRAKPFSYSGEEVFNPKRREKERGEKLVLVTSFGWW